MDKEKLFADMREHIAKNDISSVRPLVDVIVNTDRKDTFTLIKCASILKTIDDEVGCQDIVDTVLENMPDGPDEIFRTALSVRGLGRSDEAYSLMSELDESIVGREKARTLLQMDEAELALSEMRRRGCDSKDDVLLLTEILRTVGEFAEAKRIAEDLVEKDGGSYESLVNLSATLMQMGKLADAFKIARSHVKEDKKSADAMALAAYVMRINGRTAAAANYANRALRLNYKHVGALETLAMCLVEKSKFFEAKMLAGVINENSPGDPAAVRIIDACRGSQQ